MSPRPGKPSPPAQIKADAPPSPAQELSAMRATLADWPNLARYRDANAALEPPRPGERRVVFLGDSLTEGWGRGKGGFFAGRPYVNRGISGQTTPQMVLRFQQDVIALNPAVVVILGGTNDFAGNTGPETFGAIQDNFRSMVALAKQAHIRVVLSSVLPASYFPWRPGLQPAEDIRALNRWLEQLARREHLVYVDYYSALVNDVGGMRPELAVDKAVHPNEAGYALMEPLAEAAIAKALTFRLP